MPSPIADVLRALASTLEGVGDGWYLFGAQAALLRGSRRLTADVDVTVLPGQESTSLIVQRMQAAGFTLRVADVDDFVAQTRVLPFVHDSSGMPVDLVLGGPGLEELFLQGSERVDAGGVSVPVPTAEHLIVMKLLAGRAKDLDDATAIARASKLDHDEIDSLVAALAESLGERDIVSAWSEVQRRLARG